MPKLLQGPTGRHGILQIHPTRRCNLRCLHCYSQSGPEERAELEASLIEAVLEDAARLGFDVLAVSGGEPFLYRGLAQVLTRAKELGLFTSVTTNGTLLSTTRLRLLVGLVDLLAISVDGQPGSHNEIRASPDAFERLVQGLPKLRATGMPFGFIFTLTQYNLHELEWVANFALEQGARLLQIHPLEPAGRALVQMEGSVPDSIESSYALLEATRLQHQYEGRLNIQLDLSYRPEAERVYAGTQCEASDDLASLVSPLVLETDGTLVPLEYGFARRYALGSIHQARLATLAPRWRAEVYPAFRKLCEGVFTSQTAASAPPVFNWYEAVSQAASLR